MHGLRGRGRDFSWCTRHSGQFVSTPYTTLVHPVQLTANTLLMIVNKL